MKIKKDEEIEQYCFSRDERTCTISWSVEKLEEYYRVRYIELDEIEQRRKARKPFYYPIIQLEDRG